MGPNDQLTEGSCSTAGINEIMRTRHSSVVRRVLHVSMTEHGSPTRHGSDGASLLKWARIVWVREIEEVQNSSSDGNIVISSSLFGFFFFFSRKIFPFSVSFASLFLPSSVLFPIPSTSLRSTPETGTISTKKSSFTRFYPILSVTGIAFQLSRLFFDF